MYSQKTYKTIHHHEVQLRRDTVCMRENDFYVSTVRDFRDRRYEFKELVKVWKGRYDEGTRTGNIALQKESTDRIAFYDSQ
jgi:DNA polymerase epsilon subunit 1